MDAVIMGQFIAKLRKEQKMTQKDLAEKLCVTDKAVSKWERGRGIPDIVNIENLSEILGVSVSELLQGERNVIAEIDESERNAAANVDLEKYAALIEAYEKRHRNFKKIFSVALISVGVILIMAGVYFYMFPNSPFSVAIQSASDGPTAIYSISKTSVIKPVLFCVSGIISAVGGFVILLKIKNKRRKNK